jgi:peroxiredoxin
VLGVSMDEEGWEIVKPYIQAKQVNYRMMVATEEVAQKYGGVEALPTTFMIDREGKIASTHIGLVAKKDYENEIAELLPLAWRCSPFPQ